MSRHSSQQRVQIHQSRRSSQQRNQDFFEQRVWELSYALMFNEISVVQRFAKDRSIPVQEKQKILIRALESTDARTINRYLDYLFNSCQSFSQKSIVDIKKKISLSKRIFFSILQMIPMNDAKIRYLQKYADLCRLLQFYSTDEGVLHVLDQDFRLLPKYHNQGRIDLFHKTAHRIDQNSNHILSKDEKKTMKQRLRFYKTQAFDLPR